MPALSVFVKLALIASFTGFVYADVNMCKAQEKLKNANLCNIAKAIEYNLVKIEVIPKEGDSRIGTGLIVGGGGDNTVFVATANHVLRGRAETDERGNKKAPMTYKNVSVVLKGVDENTKIYAQVMGERSKECDIGVIQVQLPPTHLWSSDVIDLRNTTKIESSVSKFTLNDDTGWFQLSSISGSIAELQASKMLVKGLYVEEGDSGSPLLSSNGLIGLLLETGQSGTKVCTINNIKQLFSDWGYPWQLNSLSKNIDITGSWQYFETEDNLKVAPGGAVEIKQIQGHRFKVDIYDKNLLKNGEGYAVQRANEIQARITTTAGFVLQSRFKLPSIFPKKWTHRSVNMPGEVVVIDKNGNKNSETALLEYLGKDLLFEQFKGISSSSFDGSIQLPKSKLQREFRDTVWQAKLKNPFKYKNALAVIRNDSQETSKWIKGVYIRFNADNSISLDHNKVPTKNTKKNYNNSWFIDENIIKVQFFKFMTKFDIPIRNKNSNYLRGNLVPNASVFLELRKIKELNKINARVNDAGSKSDIPHSKNVLTLKKMSQGNSLFGKHYKPLSPIERQQELDWDWSKKDLTRADKVAKKYNINTATVMSIANLIEDNKGRPGEPTPFDIAVGATFDLSRMGHFNSVDLIATIRDKKFELFLIDIAKSIVGVDKNIIKVYQKNIKPATTKVELILQQCGSVSFVNSPEFWDELDCDIERLL